MSATASPRHSGLAEFFAPEVFQTVLSDPATASRLKSFCESSACVENIVFLEKIDQYSRLLNQARELLSEIDATYISLDATEPINITASISNGLTSSIDTTINVTLPAMQDIFVDARVHVESLIREDVYPRFVTQQMTASATMALSKDRNTYQGLGDCFCLTDPNTADNAILYASDGFINVTGYSRRDIVPRNCRFLQGAKTDRSSVNRIKSAIDNGQDSVELLLNYRKDGTPFWNLLYVTPLHDETGNIVFFLGGQIDCSTTIHGIPDVLRILDFDSKKRCPTYHDELSIKNTSPRKHFRTYRQMFKSWSGSSTEIKQGAGMEDDLVGRLGYMSLETQFTTFQSAYSKYLVLKVSEHASYNIAFYSKSAADLLCLNLARGTTEPIVNKDIFKVLAERSPFSSSVLKSYKKAVTDCLAQGKAVSVDCELLVQETLQLAECAGPAVKVVRQVVTHWTLCKDEEGQAKYVVLVFSET